MYPPFPHGSAYIVSRDVGLRLNQLKQRGDIQVWKLEDVSTGLWVRRLKEGQGQGQGQG